MLVSRRTWATTLAAAVIATAGSVLIASPASAASGTVKVVGSTEVEYKAFGKQKNTVTITRSGRTVTIDDKVKVKAGKGCKTVRGDATKVRCTTARTPERVTAELGGGNDSFTNKAKVSANVYGGAGNDTIRGGGWADQLRGGDGNDRIYGNGGNDQLYGNSGKDRLYGGDGFDALQGGGGADTLKGGHDIDTAWYGDKRAAVTADLDGRTGDDGTKGEKDSLGTDIEAIVGGYGDDTLTGNDGDNVLVGGSGNDTLRGRGGNDRLMGWAGNDTLSGEAGDDEVVGDEGDDVLSGDAGQDTVIGGAGDDTIRGGDGDDSLFGNVGDDDLYGEAGDDQLYGDLQNSANDTDADTLDGGENATESGDLCLAGAAGTIANCERP